MAVLGMVERVIRLIKIFNSDVLDERPRCFTILLHRRRLEFSKVVKIIRTYVEYALPISIFHSSSSRDAASKAKNRVTKPALITSTLSIDLSPLAITECALFSHSSQFNEITSVRSQCVQYAPRLSYATGTEYSASNSSIQ